MTFVIAESKTGISIMTAITERKNFIGIGLVEGELLELRYSSSERLHDALKKLGDCWVRDNEKAQHYTFLQGGIVTLSEMIDHLELTLNTPKSIFRN